MPLRRTSIELSFVRSVAVWTWPFSICSRKPANDLAGAWSEREISLLAKNASTITIKIGNRALLKKRLTTREGYQGVCALLLP